MATSYGTVSLELSHRISLAGEAIVDLGGELDIASAEVAVSYVRDVIDRHRRPVIVDLAALAFCDARGLTALVRMAGYAEQRGCTFQLTSLYGLCAYGSRANLDLAA